MPLAASQAIELERLAVMLLPVSAVLALLWRWSVEPRTALYSLGRMLIQLLLIGYVLTGVFASQNSLLVVLVLLVMLAAAAWIAIRTAPERSLAYYSRALVAIALGGGVVMLIVTQGVLRIDPWFAPESMIPLSGMILAAGMNGVSLAAERFATETDGGARYEQARSTAMRAALIPIINSLFAVGLVQIPGFMTGQVIDGKDPLIAARYQMMVMAMAFSAAGLSAGGYLWLMRSQDRPSDRSCQSA